MARVGTGVVTEAGVVITPGEVTVVVEVMGVMVVSKGTTRDIPTRATPQVTRGVLGVVKGVVELLVTNSTVGIGASLSTVDSLMCAGQGTTTPSSVPPKVKNRMSRLFNSSSISAGVGAGVRRVESVLNRSSDSKSGVGQGDRGVAGECHSDSRVTGECHGVHQEVSVNVPSPHMEGGRVGLVVDSGGGSLRECGRPDSSAAELCCSRLFFNFFWSVASRET